MPVITATNQIHSLQIVERNSANRPCDARMTPDSRIRRQRRAEPSEAEARRPKQRLAACQRYLATMILANFPFFV